jgi:hypothetical protein
MTLARAHWDLWAGAFAPCGASMTRPGGPGGRQGLHGTEALRDWVETDAIPAISDVADGSGDCSSSWARCCSKAALPVSSSPTRCSSNSILAAGRTVPRPAGSKIPALHGRRLGAGHFDPIAEASELPDHSGCPVSLRLLAQGWAPFLVPDALGAGSSRSGGTAGGRSGRSSEGARAGAQSSERGARRGSVGFHRGSGRLVEQAPLRGAVPVAHLRALVLAGAGAPRRRAARGRNGRGGGGHLGQDRLRRVDPEPGPLGQPLDLVLVRAQPLGDLLVEAEDLAVEERPLLSQAASRRRGAGVLPNGRRSNASSTSAASQRRPRPASVCARQCRRSCRPGGAPSGGSGERALGQPYPGGCNRSTFFSVNARFLLALGLSVPEFLCPKVCQRPPSPSPNSPTASQRPKKNPSASLRLTEGLRSARLLDRPVW